MHTDFTLSDLLLQRLDSPQGYWDLMQALSPPDDLRPLPVLMLDHPYGSFLHQCLVEDYCAPRLFARLLEIRPAESALVEAAYELSNRERLRKYAEKLVRAGVEMPESRLVVLDLDKVPVFVDDSTPTEPMPTALSGEQTEVMLASTPRFWIGFLSSLQPRVQDLVLTYSPALTRTLIGGYYWRISTAPEWTIVFDEEGVFVEATRVYEQGFDPNHNSSVHER